MFMKKRGEIVWDNIVFLILTLIFVSSLYLVISKNSDRDFFYLKSFSKEIALLIDNAYPNETIVLDGRTFFDISDKKNILPENILKVDNDKNEIVLVFGEVNSKIPFFTNYNVSLYFNNVRKEVILKINEK